MPRTGISAVLALSLMASAARAQVGSLTVTLDSPVVMEGQTVNGVVTGSLAGEAVAVRWTNGFGDVLFSTTVTAGGFEPAQIAFVAVGAVTTSTTVEAETAAASGLANLTVIPRQDFLWNGFVIVADKAPLALSRNALTARLFGVQAALAAGTSGCIGAGRAGLRAIADGLASSGTLDLPADAVAAVAQDYERTGNLSLLNRLPSLSDAMEIARLTSEVSRQAADVRRALPLAYVVADDPSVTSANMVLDYSFTPDDLAGFRSFLSRRIASPESLVRHFGPVARDVATAVPKTARALKAEALAAPDDPLDVAAWALHREYMDAALADDVRGLSRAAAAAAISPGADNVNWSVLVPVTAFTGGLAPSAYGGFNWALLSTVSDVVVMSPDAPSWALPLVRDFESRGKVFARVDAGKNPAAGIWRAVSDGMAGIVIDNYDGLSKKLLARAAAAARPSFSPPSPPGAPPGPARVLLPPPPAVDPAVEALEAISRGQADLLSQARRTASVAILYSPASIRAGWMIDYLASEGLAPAPPDAGARALYAWSQLLGALGIDFIWISADDVLAGTLLQRQVTTLVMPEIWCVDSELADALAAYAGAGGTIIADNGAGLLDGEYAAYSVSPLNRLFGIRRQPLTAARAKLLAPGAKREAGLSLADAALVAVPVPGSRSFAANTAVATPIGKGGAVYLNRFVESYLASDEAARSALVADVRKALAAARAEPAVRVFLNKRPVEARVSAYRYGDADVFVIEPRPEALAAAAPASPSTASDLAVARPPVAPAAPQLELRFNRYGFFYDLRAARLEGRPLGNAAVLTLQPPSSGPFILSRSEYELTGLAIRLDAARGTIYVTGQVQANNPLGSRLLRMEMYEPSGSRAPQFDRTAVAERGTFSAAVPLPVNAAPGVWRVLLRDLETGMASWADVAVQ